MFSRKHPESLCFLTSVHCAVSQHSLLVMRLTLEKRNSKCKLTWGLKVLLVPPFDFLLPAPSHLMKSSPLTASTLFHEIYPLSKEGPGAGLTAAPGVWSWWHS